jgi:biopolymer transport protein ExbD
MAELNTNHGRGKKSKPSKLDLRIDFTPMVDMMMLLITFFMFCSSLSIPQIMDIVMPTLENADPKNDTQFSESRTTTLLLGKDNKVFYYIGIPDYESVETLKETTLSENGLREILLDRNIDIVQQVQALKQKRINKEITEEIFRKEISKIKKSKEGQMVIIKPTDASSYNDLVQTLDEMQICSINRYAIINPTDKDINLMEKYETKAKLAHLN